MSTEQPGVLYSQDKQDIGEARNFPWEYPVPDIDFWRDLPWSLSASFLRSFLPEKAQQLSADLDRKTCAGTDRPAKLKLLNQLLDTELEEQDAAAPAGQTFYDADYPRWCTLWEAVSAVQTELGRLDEAEGVTRMLHERRRDPTNLKHQHALAHLLLKRDEHAEAERLAGEVRVWLDGILGRDSPQALGARRVLAEAKWKQGPLRREDAEGDLAEIRAIIDGMGDGKFAIYQEEERKAVEELVQTLRESHP